MNIRGSVNTATSTARLNETTKSKLAAVYFQICFKRLGNEIVSTKKCPIIDKNLFIARSLTYKLSVHRIPQYFCRCDFHHLFGRRFKHLTGSWIAALHFRLVVYLEFADILKCKLA
jgi:hypothetical protein